MRCAFPGAPSAVETRSGDDGSRFDLAICDNLQVRHISRTTLRGSLSPRRPDELRVSQMIRSRPFQKLYLRNSLPASTTMSNAGLCRMGVVSIVITAFGVILFGIVRLMFSGASVGQASKHQTNGPACRNQS